MTVPTIDDLRAVPHFASAEEATLAQLAAGSRITRHDAGDLVFHEGAAPRAFFVVRRGGVRVFRVAPDGRVQVLHRLAPGGTFAEAAVLNMRSYPATAEATEDGTEILEVGAATFLRLFDTDPRLPRAMAASLCAWLRLLVGRVEELSVASAGARLARYLLDLPARDSDDGLVIALPTTKRELAERLAITPETLSRQLRRWHDHAVIVSERDRIVLLEPGTLLKIAGER